MLPCTIVPVMLPKTLSHRSGSIMIAGPFVYRLILVDWFNDINTKADGASAIRLL
jgi:hypothetical protein